jgi:hypothetical protein
MISRIVVFLACFVSGFAQAQALAERPEFNALKPDERILVDTWLKKNCGAAEKGAFENRLLAIGARLEPVFWEAYRLGPTDVDLKAADGEYARRFADRQKWLRQFGEQQMGKEETERQLAVSESDYAQRERARFARGYRSAALAGLGLTGTEKSRQELRRIADDAREPLQISAREALKSLSAQRRPPQ